MRLTKKKEFMAFVLPYLGYETKEDLIENLYLKAFIDSYQRIKKTSILEEEIRDRFVKDWILPTSNILMKV
jgi:hypothetical protein